MKYQSIEIHQYKDSSWGVYWQAANKKFEYRTFPTVDKAAAFIKQELSA